MEIHQARDLVQEDKRQQLIKGWTNEQETILKMWAEKAAGYRFLHHFSSEYYRKIHDRLGMTSMFLTTIAGVGGFSDAGSDMVYVSYLIGSINIFSTFLAAIQRFLRSAEKYQMHSTMAKQFASFYRNINVELTLSPEHRTPCVVLSKACRHEYDRMMQISPHIPDLAVQEFKRRYPDVKNKPDIANGLTEIKVYERPKNLRL